MGKTAGWAGLALLLGMCWACAGPAQVFRAGASMVDITPEEFPVPVNGSMRGREATSVHDPLHVRCIVLDDGQTRVAIALVDSCMVPREVFDEAKELARRATGIPVNRMLFSATHTHFAPALRGAFQTAECERYAKFLVPRIAEAVKRADANLEPAQIGWAVGSNPTQVFNRRWLLKEGKVYEDPFGRRRDRVKMNPGYRHPDIEKPAGPIDPEVPVVAVRSIDGRPIALLANYSLHYVGGVPPLSADYFGAFANRFADLIGAGKQDPPFVALMTNGASGDINNLNFAGDPPGKQEPYEQIRIVADSVAATAHEAWKRIAYRDHVYLSMREKEIDLGVRRPDAEELERAKKILADAEAGGKKVLTTLPEIYARESALLNDYPETVKLKLQALRIGGVGITAIPCEVFVSIGLDLKKRSPLRPTFTIELANGYNGYLPTPADHELGGYETWRARSSCLEEKASEKVVSTLMGLLEEVAR